MQQQQSRTTLKPGLSIEHGNAADLQRGMPVLWSIHLPLQVERRAQRIGASTAAAPIIPLRYGEIRGYIRCYIHDSDGYIIEVGQTTDLTCG